MVICALEMLSQTLTDAVKIDCDSDARAPLGICNGLSGATLPVVKMQEMTL